MALDYNKMFSEVKAHLQEIHKMEANLESQLADAVAEREAMEKTYNAIAPLVGENPLPTLKSVTNNTTIEILQAAGISVAVRTLLDAKPDEDFTAASVRDRLAEKGWNWENYKNPQATVYTTLLRLASGPTATLKETTTAEGKKAFYSAKRADPAQATRITEKITAIGANSLVGAMMTADIPQTALDSIVKTTSSVAIAPNLIGLAGLLKDIKKK